MEYLKQELSEKLLLHGTTDGQREVTWINGFADTQRSERETRRKVVEGQTCN